MLQHGLLDNSGTWIVPPSEDQLPKRLSDAGYDVWMTNSRGNFNSFEHTNPREYSVFSMSSPYWNFSFDHMAEFDVKANIEYILKESERSKLAYIGHSQGTTQFFGANALEDYSDRVELFVGLGPVINPSHQNSPLISVILWTNLQSVLQTFGINNILVLPGMVSIIARNLIEKFKTVTWRFIQLLCGINTDPMIDLDRMPVMVRNEPGGTSLQNLLHWLQIMRTGVFAKYDYGRDFNIQNYGTEEPPVYDTKFMAKNIRKYPTLLVRGENDYLVDTPDFTELKTILSQVDSNSALKIIEIPEYGHLDYLWARNVNEKVIAPVLEFVISNY